ncbi:MAG: protease modulator HflC [Pseudomonadota bacterium]|nr:protease modulator HflC [Pseudomonadota bacterium]
MNRGVLIGLGALLVVIVVIASSALFTVHQTNQALVLQFGEPRRVVTDPGLHVKLPFIQNVAYFDRRVLEFDAPKEEIIASDQKRLVVDAFTRYRIIDPLLFFQTVNNEAVVRTRLSAIINASIRQALGGVPLEHIISGERASLMTKIRDIVNAEAKDFGIDIIDVRIKRADLPEANSEAVYLRMQTERQREAKELRAQGAEEAQKITAVADRDKVVIIAEARKQAQITRGQGDGEAVRIFAEAFGEDVEFFAFYRSMEAYREALGQGDTTMVLSPDSEFFRFFGDITGGVAAE